MICRSPRATGNTVGRSGDGPTIIRAFPSWAFDYRRSVGRPRDTPSIARFGGERGQLQLVHPGRAVLRAQVPIRLGDLDRIDDQVAAVHSFGGRPDLDRDTAADYGGRQNDDRRYDLHRDADEQSCRVGPLRMLELGKQGRSKREAELVDGDDETDNAREMLLRELLLDDEAGQRGRVSDANPEQQTTQIERRLLRAHGQDPQAKGLHDEIERGDGTTVEAVEDKPGCDAPCYSGECRQADSPTSSDGSDRRR